MLVENNSYYGINDNYSRLLIAQGKGIDMFRHIAKNLKSRSDVCQKWEYYLLKGNEYYFRGQYQTAAHCYSVSAEYLEVLVDNESIAHQCDQCDQNRCFQHYFIACQNTAHAFTMSGDLVKAEQYLSRAHYKFLAMVTGSVSASSSWQDQIRSICERSLDTLVQFLERHNRQGVASSVQVESRRLLGN